MIKYKLFPKTEEVFTNVTEEHKVLFFPLLSVDLESINKGKGKVHFVAYYRDGEDDIIRDLNVGYNFIRFQIIGYQFNGDFNNIYMFEKSVKWYYEAEEIYKEHKEKYLSGSDTAFLTEQDNRRMEIDFEYYYYIKGVINYWVTRDKYLETKRFIQGSAYSYGNSNHEREAYEDMSVYDTEYVDEILEEVLDELKINFADLDYIGLVAGYNYLEFGADEMTLFMSKDKKEVLQYHNWS